MRGTRRIRVAAATSVALSSVPTPAYAHAGHCTRADVYTTLGISTFLGLAVARPWRSKMTARARAGRLAAPLVVATLLTAGACGGSSGSSAIRPATSARLQIVEPTPNQVVGPDPVLRLNLIGATIVPATTGALRPTEGHIHVSVDGKLVSMAYGTTQDLHGLAPGDHRVQAEFVAIDHVPFRNRVIAFVLFKVQP